MSQHGGRGRGRIFQNNEMHSNISSDDSSGISTLSNQSPESESSSRKPGRLLDILAQKKNNDSQEYSSGGSGIGETRAIPRTGGRGRLFESEVIMKWKTRLKFL